MDFSYIKSAPKCPPNCVTSGEVGPVFTGVDGRPNDAGPDPSNPTVGGFPVTIVSDDTGYTPPLYNPVPTGTGKDAGAPKEIRCTKIEVFPAVATISVDQVVAFWFQVTYSDGNVDTDYNFGLPGATATWFSEDDTVLKFNEPSQIAQASNGLGYVARGISSRELPVLVSVEYSHAGTKDDPSRLPTENWFAPCDLVAELEVTVMPDPIGLSNLVVLEDFITYPFASDTVESLEIAPTDGIATDAFIEIGDETPIRSKAMMVNGNVRNVTVESVWSSSDPSVATVDLYGIVTGVAAGIVTITSTYKGFSTTAIVEVATLASTNTVHGNLYTATPIDTVIVLDRSASMNVRDAHGVTRIERAKEAALQFIANSEQDLDQIGLVGFAGTWIKGATELITAQTEADATLDQKLTDTRQTISDAVKRHKILGPCGLVEWEGTRCATAIGAGLQRAEAEINSDRHVYSHKKMVMVLTDGCENVNKPTPASVADDLKLAGTLVCVVALDCPSCATDLEALATPGLYFPSTTAYELAKDLGEIPHYVGYGEYGYSWYT